MDLDLKVKQKQFNAAMELYNTKRRYKLLGTLISVINISLQIYLLCLLPGITTGAGWQIFSVVSAFVLADLVNGLVHMIMDNNDRYDSVAGPLIAQFHLHHRTPMYRKHPLPVVYFNETGSKIWLTVYLAAIALALAISAPNPVLVHILVYLGILSSVAEVSHYLCHSSTSGTAMFLGRIGVLLAKPHHAKHHLHDNNNYAFLNGCSDPLINLIAGKCYQGYKKTTDRHFALYAGAESENR